MRVGFTGTQDGMTQDQRAALPYVLGTLMAKDVFTRVDTPYLEFHHGDCIGADEDAHEAVKKLYLLLESKIIIHPPSDGKKRAFCDGDVILPVKPYLDRNHDIVDATEVLVATPKGFEEELRSGTWATVRYAKTKSRPVVVIWPDGRLQGGISGNR